MYGVANNLVGFKSPSLRVKIERTEGSYVWVRTADILDAGTPLVLDAAQVRMEGQEVMIRYITGLLTFG